MVCNQAEISGIAVLSSAQITGMWYNGKYIVYKILKYILWYHGGD